MGRWNFALNDDSSRTLEAFAGVEYDSCCWGFQHGDARRYRRRRCQNRRAKINTANGLFLQLELKGLTGVGNNTEALLTRGIPGYENEF